MSFRNEARIAMSVVEVTASSISVDVSADSSARWSFTIAIKGQSLLNSHSDPLKIDMKVEHSAPICRFHRFTDPGIKFNLLLFISLLIFGGYIQENNDYIEI